MRKIESFHPILGLKGMALLRSRRLFAAARVLAGMSQKQLAEEAGLALSVVQALEQDTSDPKNSTMIAIADALAAHGVKLFGETDLYLGSIALERPAGPAKPRERSKG